MILSTHTCSNLLIPPQIFSHSNFFDPSIIWTQTFFWPNFVGTQNHFETKFFLYQNYCWTQIFLEPKFLLDPIFSYNKNMANIANSLTPAWLGLSALAHSYPLFPALTSFYPLLPDLPSLSQTDIFWHVLMHCCFHSCLLSIWHKTKMPLPLKWPLWILFWGFLISSL